MRLKLLMILPLLLPLITPQPIQAETISGSPQDTVQSFLVEKPPSSFPDMGANYIKTVAEPKAKADKEAAEKAAQEAAQAALVVPVVTYTPYVPPTPQTVSGGLTGSYGYAIGGNCVDEIPIGLRGEGNPINWSVTTQTPYIGGAALWYSNHVARIVGFWSNGDIEVAQQGWSGPPITRFPRSTFRGFR